MKNVNAHRVHRFIGQHACYMGNKKENKLKKATHSPVPLAVSSCYHSMTYHWERFIFTLFYKYSISSHLHFIGNTPHPLRTTFYCVTSCTCSTYRAHSACRRRSGTLLRSLRCLDPCSKLPGRCAAGPPTRWSGLRWRCARLTRGATGPWWCRRCSPVGTMTKQKEKRCKRRYSNSKETAMLK